MALNETINRGDTDILSAMGHRLISMSAEGRGAGAAVPSTPICATAAQCEAQHSRGVFTAASEAPARSWTQYHSKRRNHSRWREHGTECSSTCHGGWRALAGSGGGWANKAAFAAAGARSWTGGRSADADTACWWHSRRQ